MINKDFKTSAVITGEISITKFSGVVGIPLGIKLTAISLLFSLAAVITRKSFKIFSIKQKNTILFLKAS